MVRALAAHQCRPGSIPGLGVMWVAFVVGSRPYSKRFFSGFPGFPQFKIPNSKFQFDLESEGHRFVSHNRVLSVTLVKQSSFYLFIVLFSGRRIWKTTQKPGGYNQA